MAVGAGAAVGGGVPVFVGDGDAPGGGGVGGGVGGHGAGQGGVDGAERGGLPGWPVRPSRVVSGTVKLIAAAGGGPVPRRRSPP